MRLDQANDLLEHDYLPLENGWVRLDDGQLHVAARTHMIGCKGAMVDWWFRWLRGTEQYKMWHPRDHVFSDFLNKAEMGDYVGSTHIVREYIGGEMNELRIHFRPPSAILDPAKIAASGASAVIYARGGPMHADIWTGHVLHLVTDTPEGCVMRSRFWLGDLDPAPPGISRQARIAKLPDSEGAGLQKHCSEEMSILGGFLPGLYARHNPAGI